ncbi:hypothetical protein AALA00_13220 [Lachnospiraceae bacterium 46-15]
MKQNRQVLFANRIEELYKVDSPSASETAKIILSELPECLLPNIDEWIEGKKLSDLYIQEYSVPMILALWHSNDFISAVRVISSLEEDPDKAIRQIWNMRR